MREYKIGEIYEDGDDNYQVVEQAGCDGCGYDNGHSCGDKRCTVAERTDDTGVVFIKLPKFTLPQAKPVQDLPLNELRDIHEHIVQTMRTSNPLTMSVAAAELSYFIDKELRKNG